MEKDRREKVSMFRYRRSIPEILRYQIITKAWLAAAAAVLRFTRGAVLWTSSRSAVSSGDLPFLMTTVQGWVTILLGLALLVVYMVFDVNAMILLSSRVLHQQPVRVREVLKEAFESLRRFRHPLGLFLILYTAFLIPLAGVGLGLSLTEHFYIPDFITSVIEADWRYNLLYQAGLTAVFLVSIRYLFIFHCVLLKKEEIVLAKRSASALMKENWKNFLWNYLKYFLGCLLAGILIVAGTTGILFAFGMVFPASTEFAFRFLIVFSSFFILCATEIYILLFTPFQVIKLTSLYESYTEEDEGEIVYPEKKRQTGLWIGGICLLAFLVLAGYGGALEFDEFFPVLGNTAIIAHRGGGNLGNENTLLGLTHAIEQGINASEIDVQRTKDGYYVLNHDTTFQRVAGVKRKVSEMTLAEIKELSIEDSFSPFGSETEVSTFEEILDAANGKIHLYVELKGETADRQMADELYQIVLDRKMMEEVTFISLDYPLISYLEEQHPECTTGYLCYAALGDIAELQVDELILEEEMATPSNIDRIHEIGKKVIVWTVNKPVGMIRFYSRAVDALITDEVSLAADLREALRFRPDEYAEQYEDMMRVILHTIFVWWP